MGKPRVLCMQKTQAAAPLFDVLHEVAAMDLLPSDQKQMEAILPQYDAFLVELGLHLHRDLIARCPRLKIVATSTTGTDHIDVKALEERKIRLISLKYDFDVLDNISATAELAWALMLAVLRHIPDGFEAVKRGEWDRSRFTGTQLRGKTFGILGYGRLGRIIKDFARGFHMRVLASDVKAFTAPEGVEPVDLDTLLRESDVLSIHIHLTPENTHFINRARIAQMKRGAVLINTSRGAIVDEAALIEALERGHLKGAGVDVLEGEVTCTNISGHPMVRYARTHSNLVISPHVGGATKESIEICLAHTINKLKKALVTLTE